MAYSQVGGFGGLIMFYDTARSSWLNWYESTWDESKQKNNIDECMRTNTNNDVIKLHFNSQIVSEYFIRKLFNFLKWIDS